MKFFTFLFLFGFLFSNAQISEIEPPEKIHNLPKTEIKTYDFKDFVKPKFDFQNQLTKKNKVGDILNFVPKNTEVYTMLVTPFKAKNTVEILNSFLVKPLEYFKPKK